MQMPTELTYPTAGGRLALLVVGVGVWAAAVLVGFGFLSWYDHTPGPRSTAPDVWPADSCLRPTPGRHCLVLALHPHCPCSRATLGELQVILQQCGERLAVHVLFYTPQGFDLEWARTDLWERAAALHGVTVRCDEGGAEGRRFGAVTSGHAVLYGPDGDLLFRGGLTGGRGQTGANAGRAAVIAHVLGAAGPQQADVFGCPLDSRPCQEHSGEEACTAKK
jgi:hypothetical protein